ALVIEEMSRRSAPIYVDFVDYDEIAHHSGPDGVEARDAVAGLDKIIGIIERAAEDAPRPYRFVVLSDHGQSPGAMFAQRYRKSLEGLVQELAGEHVKVQGATAHVEHWGRISPLLSEASGINGMTRTVTSAPFRRHAGATDDAEKPSDIVVAASGNLVQLSFPGMPGRATSAMIDAAYPGLIDGIVRHPGIGLVMVRANGRGAMRSSFIRRSGGSGRPLSARWRCTSISAGGSGSPVNLPLVPGLTSRDRAATLAILENAQWVYALSRYPKKQVLADEIDVKMLRDRIGAMRKAATELSVAQKKKVDVPWG